MNERLISHLRYVASHSPYYSRLGISPESLDTFPLISKALIKENLSEILTIKNPEEKLSLVDELVCPILQKENSGVSEYKFLDKFVIEQTSGTSGIPARFPKTNGERAELAFSAFIQRRNFDQDLTGNGLIPLIHRYWNQPIEFNIWTSSRKEIEGLYAWLRHEQPRWLHMPTTLILRHADLLEKWGLINPIPCLLFIEASGSPLSATAISAAKRVFDAEIVNQYGTREMWAIGYASGNEPFLINSLAVHVELINASGTGINLPGIEGEIVVTNLVLKLLPLVRYKTGDRGCWCDVTNRDGTVTRRLLLSPDREINLFYTGGQYVSGNCFFRGVVKNIYQVIGYSDISYIKIFQLGESDLLLTLNHSRKSQQFFQLFAQRCEQLKPAMDVTLNLEEDPPIDLKDNLFVNKWTPSDSPSSSTDLF